MKMQVLSKLTSIVLIVMIIVLLISLLFHEELIKTGLNFWFLVLEVIVLLLGGLCVILYLKSKKK